MISRPEADQDRQEIDGCSFLHCIGDLAIASILVISLACAPAPRSPVDEASQQVSGDSRTDLRLEDPPYALDSVFKPEDHRSKTGPLPADTRLLDQIALTDLFEANAHLGESVAIAGDLAVAGAPYADVGFKTDAGAVCVLSRQAGTWGNPVKLGAPVPASYDRFGSSVAISGQVLVVGADRHDGVAREGGAAFVFELADNSWTHRATIAPDEIEAEASLGYSAALDQYTLVLGAPGASLAFAFDRRGASFELVARLRPPEPLAYGGFGHSVAVAGDTLVVGANTNSGRLRLAGSAYVFTRRNEEWRLEAELRSPREEGLARFGTAVAVRGKRILVGASRATVGESTRAGAAFLFELRDGRWQAVAELTNAPPRSDEEFGRSLALLTDAAVVGSQFGDAAGLNTGGALLFFRRGQRWERRAILLARDRTAISEFAFDAAADEHDVIIGAPRSGAAATATGGVYHLSTLPMGEFDGHSTRAPIATDS